MSLKYDSKQAEGTGFALLPEGEYEVFISAVEHGYAATSGNEKLTVNYKIRDDVDQEGKGTEIRFDNFVNTGTALWRFHALNKALKVDEGAEWEDFKEWMPFIKGKAVRVIVKHEEVTMGKNKGKVFPRVNGFKESTVGGEMTPSGQPTIDISDDDLPF